MQNKNNKDGNIDVSADFLCLHLLPQADRDNTSAKNSLLNWVSSPLEKPALVLWLPNPARMVRVIITALVAAGRQIIHPVELQAQESWILRRNFNKPLRMKRRRSWFWRSLLLFLANKFSINNMLKHQSPMVDGTVLNVFAWSFKKVSDAEMLAATMARIKSQPGVLELMESNALQLSAGVWMGPCII